MRAQFTIQHFVYSNFKCVVVFNCNSMKWRLNAREFVISMEKFLIIKREILCCKDFGCDFARTRMRIQLGNAMKLNIPNLHVTMFNVQCSYSFQLSLFRFEFTVFQSTSPGMFGLKPLNCYFQSQRDLSILHSHSLANAGDE